MKKTIGIAVAMFALAVCANTPPAITNVRASQREGTKLVDIYYDAADADNDLLKVRIEISDNDGAKYSVPAFSLTGDIGEGIAPGTGKHIVWDAGTDWDGEYSDQMRVKVFAIDAQGFPGMEWGNEVPPGGFLMGQDGGAEGSGPSRHVNIPWSYWLGKYEVTAQQYCDFLNAALAAGVVDRDGTTAVYSKMGAQVMPHLGGRYLMLNIGDDYDIRWNVNNFEVVGALTNYPVRVTWYGAMMFAHFYGYDLPTEAEWEKAARGPDHDDQDEHMLYPWGNAISTAMANYTGGVTKPVGYYNGNQTPIGGDIINGYGLYDVIGNVAEWTLTTSGYSVETYPQQESLVAARNMPAYGVDGSSIFRGGSCYGDTPEIYYRNSISRTIFGTSGNNHFGRRGFRVARRDGGDRPNAVCEIKEDFEMWTTKTSDGATTQATSAGTWGLNPYVYVRDNENRAFSGSKYLSGGDYVRLPNLNSIPVEIRCKVRNPESSSKTISLYAGNDLDGYKHCSVTIPKNSDYQTISLSPSQDASSYKITWSGLYLDDLEIWTIPRATGE